jgi:hypothetical protein
MLVDMVVKSATADQSTQPVVRACSADFESNGKSVFEADNEKASLCTPVYMHQPQVDNDKDFSVNHLISASQQIKAYLELQQPSCTNNAMEFAYSQSSSIGLFAGSEIHQHGITLDIIEKFIEYIQERALTKTTIVQVCASIRLVMAGMLTLRLHSYAQQMRAEQIIVLASLRRVQKT